ncbi:MAG: AraC family transcriptional regulator [Bacteroidaceae bacterium]|nr:AraC family transcriptional regulator [Bacteroidaceae bacterium]MBR1755101.1 AraC family transcriptional regulator [Bacteroidaceae bacterium]MBR1790624.1 AraC family transcriptional regulator [Bacteroidaceae bacterium]
MTKYNLREKKEAPALYRTAIRTEVIDDIYEQILRKMIVEKRYRDPRYNAQRLAEEIGTNARYISAAVSLRFQTNFPTLIAGYRLRDAIAVMTDKRTKSLNMGTVATQSGFANRQSFYSAFFRAYGKTPKQYQNEFFARLAQPKGGKGKTE